MVGLVGGGAADRLPRHTGTRPHVPPRLHPLPPRGRHKSTPKIITDHTGSLTGLMTRDNAKWWPALHVVTE